jgi:nucleoside 2-deoxyribosyltransferase
MKVYLAGPMRGLSGWNFEVFDAAEARWRSAGHQTFSPAQIARVLQYGPLEGETSNEHLRHVIHMDVVCVMSADGIALLPGWEGSAGVMVELSLALFLGLPVYDAVTMEPMWVKDRPWSDRQDARTFPQKSDWDEVWRNLPDRSTKGSCVNCWGTGYEPGGCHGAPCGKCQ